MRFEVYIGAGKQVVIRLKYLISTKFCENKGYEGKFNVVISSVLKTL